MPLIPVIPAKAGIQATVWELPLLKFVLRGRGLWARDQVAQEVAMRPTRDTWLPLCPGPWYNELMKGAQLEPGFLQIYRIFVATRMVFWVVIGPILIVIELAQPEMGTPAEIPSLTLIERLTLPNIGPVLAIEALLLILLLLPQAPRRLGRYFVPLTLLIGLVPLLIGNYWWPSSNPLQTPFVIFFFVMLVLIAWQYPFSRVAAYVLLLSGYQYWLARAMGDLPLSIGFQWLVLQGAMMLLVGYIVVQMASIQREQRAALASAYEQQAAATARLQRYAAAVEDLSISRERSRLSRELHDTLAHSLSAVTVQLEAVRSLWSSDPERAYRLLEQADETARQGLTEARRTLRDLRASPLQEKGLVMALRDLATNAAERSGATLELHTPSRLEGVSPVVEQGVYRIAQEAMENTVRHAQASHITLRLEARNDHMFLTIRDDGRGIGPEVLEAPGDAAPDHLGLQGMKERAGLIGGRLEIDSRPGEGTTLSLVAPLHNPLSGVQGAVREPAGRASHDPGSDL